jgi:hypothetical protein
MLGSARRSDRGRLGVIRGSGTHFDPFAHLSARGRLESNFGESTAKRPAGSRPSHTTSRNLIEELVPSRSTQFLLLPPEGARSRHIDGTWGEDRIRWDHKPWTVRNYGVRARQFVVRVVA